MDYRTLLLVIMILAVLLTGCTSQNNKASTEKKTGDSGVVVQNTPEQTPEPASPADTAGTTEQNISDTRADMQSGSQETMPLNDTINIYLKENPTTGFRWNATVTSGLTIENDTYIADPVKPGIVGSGGMHYWLVRSIERGNQTFDAVYMRSWEPITGNETRYTMDIQVV